MKIPKPIAPQKKTEMFMPRLWSNVIRHRKHSERHHYQSRAGKRGYALELKKLIDKKILKGLVDIELDFLRQLNNEADEVDYDQLYAFFNRQFVSSAKVINSQTEFLWINEEYFEESFKVKKNEE